METRRGCWLSWNWIWLLRPTVYMIIKPRSSVKAVCALTSELPSRSRLGNFFMIVGCQFLLTRRRKFWRHKKWEGEWRALLTCLESASPHEKLSISRPSACSLYSSLTCSLDSDIIFQPCIISRAGNLWEYPRPIQDHVPLTSHQKYNSCWGGNTLIFENDSHEINSSVRLWSES